MTKIGFKNFRKFENFPPIELGGCTFLVGPNNSGKSSFLKAFMLLMSNLKRIEPIGATGPIQKDFSFDIQGHSEHFYIGNFFSNLNFKSEDKSITFMFETDDIEYSITLDGRSLSENSALNAPIKEAYANNSELGIRFEWSFENPFSGTVNYTYDPEKLIERLNQLMKTSSDEIEKDKKLLSLWRAVQVNMFKFRLDRINGALIRDHKGEEFSPERARAVIEPLIDELSHKEGLQTHTETFYTEEANRSDNVANIRNQFFTELLKYVQAYFRKQLRENIDFMYVEAHNASHSYLLNPEDKNDYLAQSIIKYLSAGTDKEDSKKFIEHWMEKFNIGHSFEINSVYNEAYTVDIISSDKRKKSIGLLGTGSIQIFILLLRIATAIAQNKSTTICVEEPEQNLHPALQSKLADMFYEVWESTEGKIKFIVETHSEYLIRRSQVIVGDNYDIEEKLKDNPFKVYYFPTESKPYDMCYTTSGQFEKKFGDGFINEAGKLHMTVLKNSQKQN